MKYVSLIALTLAFAPPAMAQDLVRGARIYAENCAVCHGVDHRGTGPMAEILVIPPPDLTQIAARYRGVFPRVGVAWMIDGRDPLVAHGGEMPVFGHILDDMSEVMTSPGGQTIITSPEMVDLVLYLESIQD